jgi:hypothetical protein
MLEDLFKLVQGHAQDDVVNNPDVPNEKNDAVIADATHSITDGLQSAVAGGGLQNILSMFGGNSNNSSLLNNPIVSGIISNFTNKLTGTHGIANSAASGIAASLIPNVISSLISKTNDPNNSSFTLDNLLHSVTGGQSTQIAQQQQAAGNSGFSFQNLIGQFTGGQQGGGGGIMDIVSQLAGGAQSQQSGGGLMDMIKGFIK